MLQSLLTQSQYFNPRSRMGSDQVVMKTCYELKISIHAPAWGATIAGALRCFIKPHFNPRSRMGSD